MTPEKALGDAIVARLPGVKLDARATEAAKAFRAAHGAYATAYDEASEREAARHASLANAGSADEALDQSVGTLADKLIGAGLTPRNAPFQGLSRYTPTQIVKLAYAKEVAACVALTGAVRKRKAGKDVLAACAAVDRAAAGLKRSLAAFDAPQKAWTKAISKRDAQLLEWQKALTRLRILARASLVDAPDEYEALFAAPEAIAVPKTRRPRKKTGGESPTES
jgi:hypothetical protein